MLSFRPVDLQSDWDRILMFERDTRVASYGNDSDFSEARFRAHLESRLENFPAGHALAMDNGVLAGMVQAWISEYHGRRIGYVGLYYLTQAYRGRGLGVELVNFSESYFIAEGVGEYHLRVSPSNERAVRFYSRCGFHRIAVEHLDHLVWRMSKGIDTSVA